ncbi:MAG TPA: surface-adhesin E family protein [Gemmatimonadaceae bacterium]|nr:surface-adhesin E family protein [Gemmatimonadaceae bacterium]
MPGTAFDMRRAAALVISATACAAACSDANAHSNTWYRVAGDTNYVVYIDPASIIYTSTPSTGEWLGAYRVWYRTEHARPRSYKGKQFNREIVNAYVQCDSLWFKVASVTMSMNGEKPILVQESNTDELIQQDWRRIESGSLDDAAARVACGLGFQRWGRR